MSEIESPNIPPIDVCLGGAEPTPEMRRRPGEMRENNNSECKTGGDPEPGAATETDGECSAKPAVDPDARPIATDSCAKNLTFQPRKDKPAAAKND
jgi:hypothetical protein